LNNIIEIYKYERLMET